MSEGIEVTIYSVPAGLTHLDILHAVRDLKPRRVVVDAAGPNRMLFELLKATLPVEPMQKRWLEPPPRQVTSDVHELAPRRCVEERDESGRVSLRIKAPTDEWGAVNWKPDWAGNWFLAADGHGHRPRLYQFLEAPPDPDGVPVCQWVKVTDPKTLQRFGAR